MAIAMTDRNESWNPVSYSQSGCATSRMSAAASKDVYGVRMAEDHSSGQIQQKHPETARDACLKPDNARVEKNHKCGQK